MQRYEVGAMTAHKALGVPVDEGLMVVVPAPRRRPQDDRSTARSASSALTCSVALSRIEPERVVPANQWAVQVGPARSIAPACWTPMRTRSSPECLLLPAQFR
jgi:hypothetical protein